MQEEKEKKSVSTNNINNSNNNSAGADEAIMCNIRMQANTSNYKHLNLPLSMPCVPTVLVSAITIGLSVAAAICSRDTGIEVHKTRVICHTCAVCVSNIVTALPSASVKRSSKRISKHR
jgi:hypothetical protein